MIWSELQTRGVRAWVRPHGRDPCPAEDQEARRHNCSCRGYGNDTWSVLTGSKSRTQRNLLACAKSTKRLWTEAFRSQSYQIHHCTSQSAKAHVCGYGSQKWWHFIVSWVSQAQHDRPNDQLCFALDADDSSWHQGDQDDELRDAHQVLALFLLHVSS